MERDLLKAPLHKGEVAVQKRLDVYEEVNSWAPQAIRPTMPLQHRLFFQQLPFMVAAARDSLGAPWATLLSGSPGFVQAKDPAHLHINAKPHLGDALESSFTIGAEVGLLGIELETRRRNRLNGRLSQKDEQGFTVSVDQSFGNCPQYISKRNWYRTNRKEEQKEPKRYTKLDERLKSWITRADTLFIASGYHETDPRKRSGGMDVSHRGGPAGFAVVRSETELTLPDYAGNNLFNTIGNLVMDSRVGLLFVDFELGSLLQISGTAHIDWDSPEVSKHAGAKRLINIHIEQIVVLDQVLPLRWEISKGAVRELRLVDKIVESDDVTSFYFLPRDDGKLAGFKAGQYLPIELKLLDNLTVERTYSLSNGPDQNRYRISVKKHTGGLVSGHLHDNLQPGDVILASEPEGEFVLSPEPDLPVVLMSAGIGVTPMVSMLHVLAEQSRQVFFLHGSRDGKHHPLSAEVKALVGSRESIHLHILYSRPHAKDIKGKDYHRKGRIDAEVIETFIPQVEAEYYLCGPKSFLAEMETILYGRGVGEEYIHTESFS